MVSVRRLDSADPGFAAELQRLVAWEAVGDSAVSGTVAAILAGFWSVRRWTAGMADKDRSEIVIDEVTGQLIALCATSAGFWFAGLPSDVVPWPGLVVPFVLFRLFDIWKPWIIGRADRRADAAGVMLDDIWAGVFAAVCSVVAAGISHGLM